MFEFYVLATTMVISEQPTTCDSAHSWQHYRAATLRDQAVSTMTRFPTQSHYPDPTSPCPILIMPGIYLGSDKYQFRQNEKAHNQFV